MLTDWSEIGYKTKNDLIAEKKAGNIYCGNFTGGKYISIKTVESHSPIENEDIAIIEASPQVELRISYIEAKDHIVGFRLKKIKYNPSSKKWIPDGEITLSRATTTDLAGFCEVLTKISLKDVTQSQVNIESLQSGDEKILEATLRSVTATPEGRKILSSIAKTQSISDTDIINIGNRKKQLKLFNRFLHEPSVFQTAKEKWKCARDEDVWQKFFEKNQWILGYGLGLISCDQFDDAKLQQTVAGAAIFQPGGKRVDALLKTRGFLNSLLFAEIKTHTTDLLKTTPYRPPDIYEVSSHVSGAVSQVQKTVHKTLQRLTENVISITKPSGTPTGEKIYIAEPKGIVIVGTLKEFEEDAGVNPEKYSSFELYRRNIHNPEILTFDELYERARYIVGDH